MKRALLFVLLAFSLTGCAVRAGYYHDGYWYRDHDRYEHNYRHDRDRHHRDWDDRWR